MSRYTTELWAAEEFPDPLACPKCNGTDLSLSGVVYRLFDAVVKEGMQTEFSLREDQTFQETRSVTCEKCSIIFYLDG